MYKTLLVHFLCCISAAGNLTKRGGSIIFDAYNSCYAPSSEPDEARED